MSLTLEPPDNNDKSDKGSLKGEATLQLSIEKQFTHSLFCQQIQSISLEDAKQLLTELHMLYLSQQMLFVKMSKQEILGR